MTHTHETVIRAKSLNGSATTIDRTPGETALADWREAVANEIAASEASDAAPGDADLQLAYRTAVEQCRQVARLAWTRLLCPADARVRAEIVRHALWPAYDADDAERRFEAVLGGKEFAASLALAEFDERAVAELVKAVLWTGSAASAGERPRMPELSDANLDDIYAFAGDVETGARGLLYTLNSMFHEYRLAAHYWDHAHGLLSPEQLDGADAETASRREQARAQARRQAAGSAPPEPAQAARDDDAIPVPMPEEAPIMVDDAKAAIDAARVLWTSNNLDDRSPDRRVTEAFWSCIDTAERELQPLAKERDPRAPRPHRTRDSRASSSGSRSRCSPTRCRR